MIKKNNRPVLNILSYCALNGDMINVIRKHLTLLLLKNVFISTFFIAFKQFFIVIIIVYKKLRQKLLLLK